MQVVKEKETWVWKPLLENTKNAFWMCFSSLFLRLLAIYSSPKWISRESSLGQSSLWKYFSSIIICPLNQGWNPVSLLLGLFQNKLIQFLSTLCSNFK
jgi:hypothetical protein